MAVAGSAEIQGFCIGIDVGGTFTDALLTDGTGIWRAKAPTTAKNLGEGVLAACALAAAKAGTTLKQIMPRVRRFGLGTTAVTNVLATRTGISVGLITTKGFEDQLPLAKRRLIVEDRWVTRPAPIVQRRHIIGVAERIDCNGMVLVPLDATEVVEAAGRLIIDEKVRALAVSFLWSFKNPSHEEAAVAAIRQRHPDVPVFSGAALSPVMREFERTSFAVLNAYVGGALTGIHTLADKLASLGLQAPLLLVHSGGGSITVPEAGRVPLGLASSGPAAGVAASVSLVRELDVPDVITCDMGGTSFDVAVIAQGAPSRRTRSELMGIWTSLSLIDVESISAGGGSIGWADARGMLRVGPVSAGAVPGPACYGRGGTEPTVTDALVVLGYIDPTRFLGGEMALDIRAAHTACETLGRKLGLDANETAWGIRKLALEGMIKAVRTLLNSRGLDPRKNALLSFGGCGSLFTPDIAREIGTRRVIVPELASVLSAFGAATADIRRERVQALDLALPCDTDKLLALAEELRVGVLADLAADGVAERDRSVQFEFNMRFERQAWELTIPLRSATLSPEALEQLGEDFRRDYARRYGEGSMMLGAGLELITMHAAGIGQTIRASLDGLQRQAVAAGAVAAPTGTRDVQLDRGADGHQRVEVYDGPTLRPGHRLAGPALIDGADTTIWIPAGSSVTVDSRSTLTIEVNA